MCSNLQFTIGVDIDFESLILIFSKSYVSLNGFISKPKAHNVVIIR